MMAQSLEKVKELPSQLLRFFAKYPPSRYSALVLGSAIPANRRAPKDTLFRARNQGPEDAAAAAAADATSPPHPPPSDSPSPNPNADASPLGQDIDMINLSSTARALYASTQPSNDSPQSNKNTDNAAPKKPPQSPFQPRKSHLTGRWRGPQYGLRRQAQLVKLAVQHGVEPLLPPTVKSTEYKRYAAEERGKRMKGTGIGEQVKGHKWERTLKGRLETRRQAMVKMPELIRQWKERGHGRGLPSKLYPK